MHHSIGRLAAVLLVATAATVVAHTLCSVGCNQQPMPYWDQWASIHEGRLHDTGSYRWANLFSQHNEHRIVVPRVLFWLEHEWFGQRGPFLLVLTAIVQALHVAMFAWLFRRAARTRPGPQTTIAVAAVLLTFGFAASQVQNFIEPFQIQFVLVHAAATAAFAALATAAASPHQVAWTSASIAAALVSTFSMANGLAVWPLLLVMAFQLRLRRRCLVGLAAVGAVATAAYLRGFRSPVVHSSPLTALLQQPLDVATYAIAYLGSAIRNPDYSPQILGGAAVLALGAVAAVGCCRSLGRVRVDTGESHRLALLHVVAFNVATAAMTALGRVNFPIEQATSMRYVTPVLVMWSALFALYRTAPTAWPRRLGTIATACVMVSILGHQSRAVELDAHIRNLARYCGTPLMAGVQDFELMSKSGDAALIWNELAGYMIDRRLAAFAAPPATVAGRPLAGFAPTPTRRGRGAIDVLEAAPASGWAFRAEGWSALPEAGEPPAELWFVDAEGTICGCGSFFQCRDDVARVFPDLGGRLVGWRGVGTVGDEEGVVRVVTRDARGNWYDGPTRKLGRTGLTTATGVAAEVLEWRPSGRFEPAPTGPPEDPSIADAFVSLQPGVGAIEARVRAGTGDAGALVLPLRTGAVPFGSVVELLAEDGQVLQRVFPPATWDKWRRLRLDVPASETGKVLRLRIADNGSWPNQQLRVAKPGWLSGRGVGVVEASSRR